jgi:hypothetical protein
MQGVRECVRLCFPNGGQSAADKQAERLNRIYNNFISQAERRPQAINAIRRSERANNGIGECHSEQPCRFKPFSNCKVNSFIALMEDALCRRPSSAGGARQRS